MTKALELGKRQAHIAHINLREEKHGDDTVPAIDIKLEGVTLDKAELNALLGEKRAHDALFNQGKAGTLIEPVFKFFEPFKFTEKFVDCQATLYLGIQAAEYELEDVRITGLKFTPMSGGSTAVTLTVQHELDDTEIVGALADQLGRECSVAISFGKVDVEEKKQQKLALNDEADKALNRHGDNEAPVSH